MIQRANIRSPFAMIRIDVLRSGFLTLEELGLYMVMLSRPDNWEFSEFVLARELGTTPRTVHDLLKRLEGKGFARERKGRHGMVWDLFELSEQLPKGEQRKDHTVPQRVAKAFVDSLMANATNAVQTAGDAKPDALREQNAVPEPDGEMPMTREEIGQKLIDFSGKLRQVASEQKAGASCLPKPNGSGIIKA